MGLHRKLFYLLLALLPTQLGYHFWPSWTLVLGRRIDFLSPTLYITDILLLSVVILYFLETKKYFFSIPLIIFSLMNIWVSSSKEISVYFWLKIFECLSLGFYIIQSKPVYAHIVFMLSLGIWYTGIMTILQFLLQHSIGGVFWVLGERSFSFDTPGIAKTSFMSLRPYATFPHPNVLGGFIACVIPLLVTKLHNNYYKITFGLAILSIILSFSRSAWVVCGISLLYVLLKTKTLNIYIVALGIVLVALAVIYRPTADDDSVVRRVALNQAAVSMWKSSPIIGIGAGNFIASLPRFYTNRDIFFLQPVHNIYLLVLSETGMAGLFVFFIFLFTYIRKNTINLLPLSCMLLLGLFDHYPLTLQQGQLLFTIVACFPKLPAIPSHKLSEKLSAPVPRLSSRLSLHVHTALQHMGILSK